MIKIKRTNFRRLLIIGALIFMVFTVSTEQKLIAQEITETCGTCIQNKWEKLGGCFILVGSFEDNEGTAVFASGNKRKCANMQDASCRSAWQSGCYKDASQMPKLDP